MKHSTPLVVPGFSHKDRTFGDVICYRARIEDRIEGAIVIAQRTHHSPDILEVIAPVKLRDALDLEDEDEIELRVIPLHKAT
jgi:riboflavin kinase